jgi:hypothetical protein
MVECCSTSSTFLLLNRALPGGFVDFSSMVVVFKIGFSLFESDKFLLAFLLVVDDPFTIFFNLFSRNGS